MDHVLEEPLGVFVGGMVDDALGVDDAVEAAQGVQTTLLEGGQVGDATVAILHEGPCLG